MTSRIWCGLLLMVGIGGCATLPSSGPTGKQIAKSVAATGTGTPLKLVEVQAATDIPPAPDVVGNLALLPDYAPKPTDLVGPGDVLDINIYEAGVTLFASMPSVGGTSAAGAEPGVRVQKLPPSRVTDDGNITIPYAGHLHVAGRTVSEVEAQIRHALSRLSQNPQVLVTMNQSITNTVTVGGEVARPGRLVLQTNRETLSDVLALAGGYRGNSRDLTLRVLRGRESFETRVDDLTSDRLLDVRVYPGDRIYLISNPRSYSVLGASGRVDQLPFMRTRVSLVEAIAASGGANPNLGDSKAIFVFRYARDAQGHEMPIVYHINMMRTESYFLAQNFVMRDKDVLYFGNAAANQPSKLIQLISQLFSPILTVTSTVQTVQRSN